MTLTRDWTFDLDGLQFGCRDLFSVHQLDPGTATYRVQDVDSPVSEGQMFGVDLLSAPTWTLTGVVRGVSQEDAIANLRRVRSVWVGSRAAGQVSVLRFRAAGVVRRVYGRPRRFSEGLSNAVWRGWIPLVADFTLADPSVYGDLEQQVTIPIVAAPTGGLEFPAVAPFSFAGSGQRRVGLISTGGDRSAPFVLSIAGPVASGAVVSGHGWRVVTARALAAGQALTVSSLPWSAGVSLNGAPAAGWLAPESTALSGVRLDPAGDDVAVTGTDPTGTARVTVTWRPAWASI